MVERKPAPVFLPLSLRGVGRCIPIYQGHPGRNSRCPFMSRQCAAAGCHAQANGYSTLCSRHRSTKTRHGHPEQSAVKVTELTPYRKQIEKRRKANPTSAAWVALEDRWRRIQANAAAIVAEATSGRAFIRHEVQAAQHLQAIAGAAPPSLVIEVALAMFLMAVYDRRRFLSDAAFDHQLVRRVRSLADTSTGSYYSDKTKRVHRVYRDLPPRTVRAIAGHLKQAFGAAGIQLAELEHSRATRAAEDRQQLTDAIAALR